MIKQLKDQFKFNNFKVSQTDHIIIEILKSAFEDFIWILVNQEIVNSDRVSTTDY